MAKVFNNPPHCLISLPKKYSKCVKHVEQKRELKSEMYGLCITGFLEGYLK